MENQPQTQAADILVRVWGMASGRAFFQNVYARNVTKISALLVNVEHRLQPEDVIGVQHAEKKARFRVLRVTEGSLPDRIYADVQLMDGQTCPWEQLLAAKPQSAAAARSNDNKRQFPRHRTRFPLELRADRTGGGPMQTNSSDISGRGCYVETMVPLPLGTPLHLVFWIDSEKIVTTGIIRASDPGVGMGIEFTGLDPATRDRLQQYLNRLAAQSAKM